MANDTRARRRTRSRGEKIPRNNVDLNEEMDRVMGRVVQEMRSYVAAERDAAFGDAAESLRDLFGNDEDVEAIACDAYLGLEPGTRSCSDDCIFTIGKYKATRNFLASRPTEKMGPREAYSTFLQAPVERLWGLVTRSDDAMIHAERLTKREGMKLLRDWQITTSRQHIGLLTNSCHPSTWWWRR